MKARANGNFALSFVAAKAAALFNQLLPSLTSYVIFISGHAHKFVLAADFALIKSQRTNRIDINFTFTVRDS
jgi:hypothetical protein